MSFWPHHTVAHKPSLTSTHCFSLYCMSIGSLEVRAYAHLYEMCVVYEPVSWYLCVQNRRCQLLLALPELQECRHEPGHKQLLNTSPTYIYRETTGTIVNPAHTGMKHLQPACTGFHSTHRQALSARLLGTEWGHGKWRIMPAGCSVLNVTLGWKQMQVAILTPRLELYEVKGCALLGFIYLYFT